MRKIRASLKEAITKVSLEEAELAAGLARAVLSPGADEDRDRHEAALLAKQRTVDALKLALARLPEAADTY